MYDNTQIYVKVLLFRLNIERVSPLRFRAIKSSVGKPLFNPVLVAILILSGTVSAMSFPLTGYAQNGVDNGSGEANSDGSLEGNVTIDETQNTPDQNLDGTASDVKPSQAKSIELVDTWNSLGNSHTRYNHPASIADRWNRSKNLCRRFG